LQLYSYKQGIFSLKQQLPIDNSFNSISASTAYLCCQFY